MIDSGKGDTRSVAGAAKLEEFAEPATIVREENLLEWTDYGCILQQPSIPQEGKSPLKGDPHGKLYGAGVVHD